MQGAACSCEATFEATRDSVDADDGERVLDALRALQPDNLRPSFRPYVACPVCQAALRRRSHPLLAGVIAHACTDHGAWIERMHLLRVLQAIEAHGAIEITRREVQSSEHDDDKRARDWKDAVAYRRRVLDEAVRRGCDWCW